MSSSDDRVVRTPASGAVDSRFDSESDQANDLKIGVYDSPTLLDADT